MTDPDWVQRMRTAVITVAVFLAVGAGAYALFQMFRGAAEAPRISRVPQALPVPEYDFAYASTKDGDYDLYLATLDRKLELRLTNGPLAESGPKWSPDGRLIAYSLFDRSDISPISQSDIWVMAVSEGEAHAVTSGGGDEAATAWSSDGTRLAFTTDRSIIEVINVDGSGRRRLTDGTTPDSHPAWSPDGTRIAYAHVVGDETDLWVMDQSGTSKKPLMEMPGSEAFPAWSPDGSFIAFVGNNSDIHVFSVADEAIRRITNDGAAIKTDLSWSPDGRRILYSVGPEGKSDLYVVDVDGGTPRKVVSGPADDSSPAWNPAAASST